MGRPKNIGVSDAFGSWNSDIMVARELGYSDEVIHKLQNESKPLKRQHILTSARKELVKKAEERERQKYMPYNERKRRSLK